MAPIERKSYDFRMKNEAIMQVTMGTKRCEVMAQYGISSSTLTEWIKQKTNIAAKLGSGKSKVKRLTPLQYPKTEEAVKRWFTENRNNDVAIDDATFRVKALEFSKKLGEKNFNGSVGWLTRFKKRNDIIHYTISGQANSVDQAVVDEFKATVPGDLLKQYAPKDVYNIDEAGLQYHAKSKKGQKVQGKKQSKHLTEVGQPFTVGCLDHVLTEDEGLQITGIATVDDIVRDMKAENSNTTDNVSDDEDDQDPPTKPSYSEFMKGLELVERYLSFEHGSDGEKLHLNILQTQAWAIRKQPSRTQTTLVQYFRKAD